MHYLAVTSMIYSFKLKVLIIFALMLLDALASASNMKSGLIDYENHPRRHKREKSISTSNEDQNSPNRLVFEFPKEIMENLRRKEKCMKHPFKENVAMNGCTGTVTNYLCIGLCMSFSAPQSSDDGLSRHALASCSHCAHNSTKQVPVKLHCPMSPPIVEKFTIVDQCVCQAH